MPFVTEFTRTATVSLVRLYHSTLPALFMLCFFVGITSEHNDTTISENVCITAYNDQVHDDTVCRMTSE